jgi:hypothetical protein
MKWNNRRSMGFRMLRRRRTFTAKAPFAFSFFTIATHDRDAVVMKCRQHFGAIVIKKQRSA